jgi:hypothetical protein
MFGGEAMKVKLLLTLGLLIVFLVPVTTAFADDKFNDPVNPGTSNLVACYDFSETSGTRYDYTANHHNLTDYNTVGYDTGIIGNAASLELDNSEALYLSSSDFNTGDNYYYFGAWVKLSTASGNHTVAAKWGSDTTNQSWLLIVELGVPTIYLRDPANANTITTYSSTTLSTGAWYYLEWWYDPESNLVYLNVNNGTPASISLSGGSQTTTNEFSLGAHSAHAIDLYDGLIDSALIYKGFVPSSNERDFLYNSGEGFECSDLGEAITTETFTPTYTNTATFTLTATLTETPTRTLTPSHTPTFTNTFTPTDTPTNTPTLSTPQQITATYSAAYPVYVSLAKNNLPTTIMMSILCGMLVVIGVISGVIWLNKNKK